MASTSSTNFRIEESFFGPGGNLDSNSNSYKLQSGQSSVGNIGGGEAGSTNFSLQSGSTTTAEPRLECQVNTSNLNFGNLSTALTTTGTASFSVLNYTSYGYAVTILGNPPSSGAHSLSALSTNSASTIGTEQFGINLRANTTPVVGANPTQVPSSGSFSFGGATSNYNIPDSFRYVAGETIASASRSSGETDYTISYIINASSATPGGNYSASHTILCTGTY